jgi:hypothetical protein
MAHALLAGGLDPTELTFNGPEELARLACSLSDVVFREKLATMLSTIAAYRTWPNIADQYLKAISAR